MNDEALMQAARRIDPLAADAYRDMAGTPWGRQTLESILAATPASRRPWVRKLAAVAAAAAVVTGVVAVVASDERPEPRQESHWAPKLVRMAQESPRLLVTAPGWKVTRADDYGAGGAEMRFENGRDWADIYWYPGELYESYVDDRRQGADATSHLRVAGNDAVLFRHDGTALGTTFYALWQAGPHAVELRTDVVPTEAEFRRLAASIEVVDVDTWLSALPENVVKPEERERAVERLVADVPVPPEADLGGVASRDAPGDGGSLGFYVATEVVCGWVDHWAGATDEAARRDAVEALSGAGEWHVFRKGGMALEYVEDVAAAMAAGEPVAGDRPASVADGYRRHLGCEEG